MLVPTPEAVDRGQGTLFCPVLIHSEILRPKGNSRDHLNSRSLTWGPTGLTLAQRYICVWPTYVRVCFFLLLLTPKEHVSHEKFRWRAYSKRLTGNMVTRDSHSDEVGAGHQQSTSARPPALQFASVTTTPYGCPHPKAKSELQFIITFSAVLLFG